MKRSIWTVALLSTILLSPAVSAGDLFEVIDVYDSVNSKFVYCADFNNDGYDDMCLTSGGLSVMLNNGDGTFGDTAVYETIYSPYELSGADFDFDGDIDLVIPSPVLTSNKNIHILKNNGDGTFSSGFKYYAHGSPRWAVTGEFSGDTIPDIAVVGLGRDSIAILYGNGDATFNDPVYIHKGGKYTLNAADFDGDGDIDLVSTNADALPVKVHRNSGTGTFYTAQYAGGTGQIAVGDFDADGDLDIAVLNVGGAADSVAILLNNGDATFTDGGHAYCVFDGQDIYATDLDGDGACELVVAGGSCVILPNDGTATFGEPMRMYSGQELDGGDFNNDGNSDLVIPSTSAVTVLTGRGDGTFVGPLGYAAGDRPGHIWGGDLNSDGFADFAVTNSYVGDDVYSGCVFVLMSEGDGGLAEPIHCPTGFYTGGVCGADIDNNGTVDLVASNGSGDDFSLLLNNGDGTFGDSIHFGSVDGPGYPLCLDLDGDGLDDVAVSGSNGLNVLLNNGDTTFATAVSYSTANGPEYVGGGDFDDDGDIDLAVLCYNTISLFFNNGDGTYVDGSPIPAGSAGTSFVVEDFDGDGLPDLLAGIYQRDSVQVFFNNGDSTFTAPAQFAGGGLQRLCAVDIDDDGDLDIVCIVSPRTGLGVLLNDGSGNFAPVEIYRGPGGSNIAGADIDGDGDNDVATTLFGAGAVFVNINRTYQPAAGCCGIYTSGYTGNCNCSADGKLTLSDVTSLIDHAYISKMPLCCYASGNTNGSWDDGQCKITLGDVTRLIDALYISKGPTELCLAGCER